MTAPDLSRIRDGYDDDIAELRRRWTDEQITDALERYRHGGMDRDTVMAALDIDYIGTLYELISVYQIAAPEPDRQEEECQATMMRLLLDGKEVPPELRQPASWRVRH
ncbi:hypothetical protein [Rhizobium leguminosarum]|uniref:Uncharacterized protein n=1 Tax=Rhizobium leguminosarum TaxID=384 RepID=A0A1B1C3V5_RHILE|nr:hypothetical protein [Rhizobium leguminosarum]ANP84463.1 hypothetical protein BA011_01040 [Rhizobium leguminosarum]